MEKNKARDRAAVTDITWLGGGRGGASLRRGPLSDSHLREERGPILHVGETNST